MASDAPIARTWLQIGNDEDIQNRVTPHMFEQRELRERLRFGSIHSVIKVAYRYQNEMIQYTTPASTIRKRFNTIDEYSDDAWFEDTNQGVLQAIQYFCGCAAKCRQFLSVSHLYPISLVSEEAKEPPTFEFVTIERWVRGVNSPQMILYDMSYFLDRFKSHGLFWHETRPPPAPWSTVEGLQTEMNEMKTGFQSQIDQLKDECARLHEALYGLDGIETKRAKRRYNSIANRYNNSGSLDDDDEGDMDDTKTAHSSVSTAVVY